MRLNPKQSPGSAVDRKMLTDNHRPRTVNNSKNTGIETPKRMKVETKGEAVMSLEMGGAIPHTTTTNPIAKRGRTLLSRSGDSNTSLLEPDLTRKTDGTRDPSRVIATQPQKRRHGRELRWVGEILVRAPYRPGTRAAPSQELPNLQEFRARP